MKERDLFAKALSREFIEDQRGRKGVIIDISAFINTFVPVLSQALSQPLD
jgi:hypothetical protein